MTTWRRSPPASIASTKGLDRSSLRPEWCSILSTRARTSSSVRIRLVNSATPPRATNTREAALIHISSTDGSSISTWSGPRPQMSSMRSASICARAEGNRSGACRSMARSMSARTAAGSRAASMPPAANPSRTRAARERVMASIAAPPCYRPSQCVENNRVFRQGANPHPPNLPRLRAGKHPLALTRDTLSQ